MCREREFHRARVHVAGIQDRGHERQTKRFANLGFHDPAAHGFFGDVIAQRSVRLELRVIEELIGGGFVREVRRRALVIEDRRRLIAGQ